jgi:hypothetical protein
MARPVRAIEARRFSFADELLTNVRHGFVPPTFTIESNRLTHAQFCKSHDARMLFRTLATLAFAVSFDLLFYGGKHTHAVQTMALLIYRHF